MKDLFKKHIENRLLQISKIIEREQVDALIIESGFPQYYFLDDQTTPFKPNPNFLFFCPDHGEGHILKISPGKKPKLYYYIPTDFWHETSRLTNSFWEAFFDIEIFNDYENIWTRVVSQGSKETILSPLPDLALEKGCSEISEAFLSQIHWMRISKSEYEIECIKRATQIASLGHEAAKEGFFGGKSELDVYNDYLLASQQKQTDLPYGNIIAFNEKAAVLHYQKTRTNIVGQSLLIDAGARFQGYCSDITRTYFSQKAHPVFKTLHEELEKIQLNLCKMIKPNHDYLNIQKDAHDKITRLLCLVGIIKSNIDEAGSLQISQSFFPHGVGHALGLQVHDVGGKQSDDLGHLYEKDDSHPYLRTLRKIQTNDVLTVEPGIYFIPILLNSLKGNPRSAGHINWSLIEDLLPFGGIRIEDNVVAGVNGPNNLTRSFLPN